MSLQGTLEEAVRMSETERGIRDRVPSGGSSSRADVESKAFVAEFEPDVQPQKALEKSCEAMSRIVMPNGSFAVTDAGEVHLHQNERKYASQRGRMLEANNEVVINGNAWCVTDDGNVRSVSGFAHLEESTHQKRPPVVTVHTSPYKTTNECTGDVAESTQ